MRLHSSFPSQVRKKKFFSQATASTIYNTKKGSIKSGFYSFTETLLFMIFYRRLIFIQISTWPISTISCGMHANDRVMKNSAYKEVCQWLGISAAHTDAGIMVERRDEFPMVLNIPFFLFRSHSC